MTKKNKVTEERYATMAQCVGCGMCCKQAACTAGVIEAWKAGIQADECPFLYWVEAEGRYECQLAEQYSEELAIGIACSSSLFNTDREQTIQRLQRKGLPLVRPKPKSERTTARPPVLSAGPHGSYAPRPTAGHPQGTTPGHVPNRGPRGRPQKEKT